MSEDARPVWVLGGGGVAGIAWEVGILAGLADEGVTVTPDAVLIGTSAGAVVGAQVASGTPAARAVRTPTRRGCRTRPRQHSDSSICSGSRAISCSPAARSRPPAGSDALALDCRCSAPPTRLTAWSKLGCRTTTGQRRTCASSSSTPNRAPSA